MNPLITRAQLDASALMDTDLAQGFRERPMSVWDVGARWGIDPLFSPLASLSTVTAFEADPVEAAALEQKGVRVQPFALAGREGQVTLHCTSRANNSSIHPIKAPTIARYGFTGFDVTREEGLRATTMDRLRALVGDPEILKMDVQGAELDILLGGTFALKTVAAVICEVQFMPTYEDIGRFSEIEMLLRSSGLAFYGFLDPQHRSTHRIDKRTSYGRERLIQADAVFFRDPFESAATARQIGVVLFSALALGYFDFAAEIADRYSPALVEPVQRLARTDLAPVLLDLLNSAPDTDRNELLTRVGKFVDVYRDRTTYHDLTERWT